MALIRRKGIVRGKSKKRAKRANKVPSISKLMKECDRLFSLRLRTNNADSEGICTCYTCGYRAPLKRVQAGHLISRWYKIIRWHENNVRVQCWVCNIYKKGDSLNFRNRLIDEIGESEVQILEKKAAQKDFKLTREFLESTLASLTT